MKKHYFFLSIIALFALISSPALAKDEGFYLSALVGAGFANEAKNVSESGTFNIDFDPGINSAVAIGYDFGETHPAIGKGRLEMELGYRSNGLKEMDFLEAESQAGGDLTVISLMFNTIGETHLYRPWIPYFLLGGGAAQVSLDEATVSGYEVADDDDLVLAYQVGVGTGYELSEALTLDVGYRYFSMTDPEFTDVLGEDFETRYSNHLLHVGVRYTF